MASSSRPSCKRPRSAAAGRYRRLGGGLGIRHRRRLDRDLRLCCALSRVLSLRASLGRDLSGRDLGGRGPGLGRHPGLREVLELRGNIGLRPLLPGALLASLLLGGATATSPFFLGPMLNEDGKHFGSFGVVIALLAWGFVLTTLSLASAVFSPVWADLRESERHVPEAPDSLTQ